MRTSVVPIELEGGSPGCQVAVMVSMTTPSFGAADKVPDWVHQVAPVEGPTVILHDPVWVVPLVGGGSATVNFSWMASPCSTERGVEG